MPVNRHKRQILLFLVAIFIPAAVLIGLAGRLVYQDQELAAKRAVDQRRAAVDQLRREFTARLEAIKLQEINGLIRSRNSTPSPDSGNPAVVFIATIEGDRLVQPWDVPPATPSAEFARHRMEGEALEFMKHDFNGAAAAYRAAFASARRPQETGEARLLIARALTKAGNTGEASKEYQALLSGASGARDDQGVGYRFYAAERLIDGKRDSEAVFTFLHKAVGSDDRLTLPELYMIRTLLGSSPGPRPDARLTQRIAETEEAMALTRDFVRVRAQIESSTASGTVWVPYGPEPWLVTIAPPMPPFPGIVLVVSSQKTTPPGVKLLSRTTEGDALGDAFPGLRIEWADNRFLETTNRGLPVAIWVAGLAMVLGLAVFCGYLILRDVNRDVEMTETRSQFVASVSHELKTPLTSIRMFAETLSMGRANDRMKSEYLEIIVNESERLARLVDNVLDFSKLEQGKKMYRLRPTRLDEVAGSAVRAMQFPFAQQGFQLRVSMDEDIPELQADADAIQQAILNLLTNAMKYSGEAREIDLRLSARNGDAVIEVADRGLGMGPEEQKHVFDKFYRAPSHESRLIAGTGLGLTLVAHIAKAHGGRVEVESEPGVGSTFSILIPIPAQNGAHKGAQNGVHA
jgi:signal transduction histidine kinase